MIDDLTPATNNSVAVLFSGGRDSSLAACLYAMRGWNVKLLSFNSGIGIGSELATHRYEELKARFPERIVERIVVPIFGIFRRIAIVDIERDFAKYKINLVLLGEKLAMHAAATVYCLQKNMKVVADGTSGYQSNLPEQKITAVNLFQSFHKEYGLDYETPILPYESENQVKYTLMEIGVTTKSLEGISVFADSFSDPPQDLVQEYIEEKIPLCRQYIKLMLKGGVSDVI